MRPAAPDRARWRLTAVLFGASALTRTAVIMAVTVAPLVAKDALGSATWAGLPSALSVVGIGIGVVPLSAVMARYGRRPGMVVGSSVAVAGVLGAALAAAEGSYPLLVASLFVFGLGVAAERLSRYAAAEIHPATRRGTAIAVVVWAGTVGSVAGPLLLEPARRLVAGRGWPGLVGPFGVGAVLLGAAAVLVAVALRPDPLALAPEERVPAGSGPGFRLAPVVAHPRARIALLALVVGQTVMVLLMSMTPVHIRSAGGGLAAIGVVIGAHTLGMFALSPLTGMLADRLGRLPVVAAGQVVLLVAAIVAAPASGDDRVVLVVALFLLGLGWNLGFVAGTAMIAETLPAEIRVVSEGAVDAMVWGSGAVASLASGMLLGLGGYGTLGGVGAALTLVPLLALVRGRRTVAAVP